MCEEERGRNDVIGEKRKMTSQVADYVWLAFDYFSGGTKTIDIGAAATKDYKLADW